MKKINVKIDSDNKQKNYGVFIGSGILKDIGSLINLKEYTKALIVTDENINSGFLMNLRKLIPTENDVLVLKPGESHKSLESIQKIWKKLLDFGCDRKSLIINLGGGVICDLGGFAASTYMRGIDFLQIPTTLLAMTDASIGGKTGINFLGFKNLIGTFQQPVGVIIDVDVLSTLPRREFISGFGEIIKHGLIADKKYFELVVSKKPLEFSKEELIEIIEGSNLIKIKVVSFDEKEEGLRKILNFGHTIAHGIELSNNNLLHGEAVAIGMIAEASISLLKGLISDKVFNQIEKGIKNAGLPEKIKNVSINDVMLKIQTDKKNKKGKISWTLLQGIGKAVWNQEVENDVVKKALEFILK